MHNAQCKSNANFINKCWTVTGFLYWPKIRQDIYHSPMAKISAWPHIVRYNVKTMITAAMQKNKTALQTKSRMINQ